MCHRKSHLLDAYVPGTGLCYIPTVISLIMTPEVETIFYARGIDDETMTCFIKVT